MSDPAQLLAQLLADQRQRWAKGERILVEEYRRQSSEFLSDAERLLDLIYNEIFLRKRAGETPSLNEYLGRFPALAEALRLQFEVHGAIQTEGAGTRPVVAGYELLEEIGQGGMGLVYRARRRCDGGLTAVKLVRPELAGKREVRKRFLTEARAVTALDHPNIVKVLEVGESAAGLFLVMELVDGISLDAALRPGPLTIAEAVRLITLLAEAVHHAHERGIIHRDLKPANILLAGTHVRSAETAGVDADAPTLGVRSVDQGPAPKISDFGLAKVLRTSSGPRLSSTQHGVFLGTPAYMPPEQMGETTAQPGPWNDVYSLGGILFACLTGRPPYEESNFLATLLRARLAAEPPAVRPLRSDVPEHLEQICRKCLNKSPAERFPTALALADALRAFAANWSKAPAQRLAAASLTVRLIPLAGGARSQSKNLALLAGPSIARCVWARPRSRVAIAGSFRPTMACWWKI